MLVGMLWRRFFSPVDPENWQLALAVIIPTAVFALVAARLATRAAARLIQSLLRDSLATSSPLVRGPLRLIGLATFLLVFFVLLFPAFELAGLHPRAGLHLRTLGAWTFDSGLRALLIVAVAYATIRTVAIAVKRFEHDVNFGTGLDALERAKRARTLGTVLTNITTSLVLIVATLMILNEFGVNTSAAVTGAGIVGVALGFGAQTLVRDLIGGFFLILENQVRVGDVVAMNGIGGLVEAINLRTTVLRDEEGTVHIIPNGAITTLANRSMHFSFYVVNLPLAYAEDTDKVSTILREVGEELRRDDAFMPFILEPLEIIGVDAFEETAVRLKARIKTAPLKQWYVGRELRRRLKKVFEARGVELWSPQKTVAVNSPLARKPSSSGPATPGRS
jgi:moderate conductance mechanosensitive channel